MWSGLYFYVGEDRKNYSWEFIPEQKINLAGRLYLSDSRKICVQYCAIHTRRKCKKHSFCKYHTEKTELVLILNDKLWMLFNANPFQKRTYKAIYYSSFTFCTSLYISATGILCYFLA